MSNAFLIARDDVAQAYNGNDPNSTMFKEEANFGRSWTLTNYLAVTEMAQALQQCLSTLEPENPLKELVETALANYKATKNEG